MCARDTFTLFLSFFLCKTPTFFIVEITLFIAGHACVGRYDLITHKDADDHTHAQKKQKRKQHLVCRVSIVFYGDGEGALSLTPFLLLYLAGCVPI